MPRSSHRTIGLVARTILTPVGLGILAALAVFALILGDPGPREPRRSPRPAA